MTSGDRKSWMLTHGECEEVHCLHLVSLTATQDDPAERSCGYKGNCPHDEPARLRFQAFKATLMEEALSEEWDRLLAPIERFLDAPDGAVLPAAQTLRAALNAVIDGYTLKCLEARREL